MLALYRQGESLAAIGKRYKITRERVRQILNHTFGITAKDGGACMKSRLRIEALKAERNRRYIAKYGMPYREFKELSRSGVRLAYYYQKRSAKNRGIAYHLTLRDFWEVWKASGKWPMMGRGKGKYCLTRIGDIGAYEVGNVVVMTNEENGRLYAASKIGKKMRPKEMRGVCLLYPGYAKPWIAYHKKKKLGLYATSEEAYAARRAYIESVSA